MTVVAVVGGVGAPGATTTALGLTLSWPLRAGLRVVLIEADPDGGAVLAGALRGRVSAQYGLHQLGLAHRQGKLDEFFFQQLIDLTGGERNRLLLPGLADFAQAASLAHTWEPLARLLAWLEGPDMPHDVVVDLGRSGTLGSSAVLARKADVVLVVVRGTLRSATAARVRVEALRRDLDANGTGADALGLAVVEGPDYPAGEIAKLLGLPLLMSLPYETRTAEALSDGRGEVDKRAMRSRLMRQIASGADEILSHARARQVRLWVPGSGPGPGLGSGSGEQYRVG
ncbi:MinD/ParA family protein [Embleya sp. NPDC050154]|uniref:MinD/ParA family protein n=1 Tax=Embleya sp. NPDC050154 TaxID=3363988 RepID=UPI00378DAEA3